MPQVTAEINALLVAADVAASKAALTTLGGATVDNIPEVPAAETTESILEKLGADPESENPRISADYLPTVTPVATTVTKYGVHSAFGEGLIDMVKEKAGKGDVSPRFFYFSTNKPSDITAIIGSSTGYVLPILADGSVGTQAGDGNAAVPESITFSPGGGYTSPRAAGIMSVANGATTPSGSITHVDLSDDNLTALDLVGLTDLTTLNVNVNQLTLLDVGECIGLTTLNCSDNQLPVLGVRNNTALTTLNCELNNLTTLDIGDNAALTTLLCGSNRLTEAAVNQILQDLDAAGLTDGTVDIGGSNAAPTGAGLTARANLEAKGWTFLNEIVE
jgi:hypothetical protein